MKIMKFRIDPYMGLGFLAGAILAVGLLVSCGGSSSPSMNATTGTVNVSMTDPATCNGPTGFNNVYVTVTKVTANINTGAGPNDSGWQTLVDLTNSPMQIDLLSLANPSTTCLLKMLGSSGPLPAGKYQQIRFYLLSNSPSSGEATPGTNLCKSNSGWNCVVKGTGANAVYSELQLSSQVQTGIKIPSTNIVSGGMTITAGQSTDLNIDFQSCESIVREGNGKYRLKPVLFAGEVSQNMNTLSGQVVAADSSGKPVLDNNGNPTPIAGATVLIEQATSGVETVVDSTTTDSNGSFYLCPEQGGTSTLPYDIVVTAQTPGAVLGLTGTVTYNPTVAFGVPLGSNLNQIPLVPETASTAATGGAATISGEVDTTSGTAGTINDVTLTPTMSINSTSVVIPVFSIDGNAPIGQPPSVTTAAGTCSGGSTVDCDQFTLTVPASNPNVGTFSNSSISYAVASGSSVTYSLTASGDSCTPATAASIVVTPDGTASVTPNLMLTGCTSQ